MIVGDRNCHYFDGNSTVFDANGLGRIRKVFENTDRSLLAALNRYAVIPILDEAQKNGVKRTSSPLDYNCIKPWFKDVWPVIIFIFVVIFLVGLGGNIYMVTVLVRQLKFRQTICILLMLLCLLDVLKCISILPLTIALFLWRFWHAGKLLCQFAPFVQQYLVVLKVVTYVLIALDRYMIVFHKASYSLMTVKHVLLGLTMIVFVFGLLNLPILNFISYLDFGLYLDGNLVGQGLCLTRAGTDVTEYYCTCFIGMFVFPLLVMSYLLAKTSKEMSHRKKDRARNEANRISGLNEYFPPQSFRSDSRRSNRTTTPDPRTISPNQLTVPVDGTRVTSSGGFDSLDVPEDGRASAFARMSLPDFELPESSRPHSSLTFIDSMTEENNELEHQINALNRLGGMAALFFGCWTPIELLALFTNVVEESANAQSVMDCIFLGLLCFAFISVAINPLLLVHQQHIFQNTIHSGVHVFRRLSATVERVTTSSSRRSETMRDLVGSSDDASVSFELRRLQQTIGID